MRKEEIQTWKTDITSANILSVEAGTNTPMGGDAGHGGKTVIKIHDSAATAWDLLVKKSDGKWIKISQPDTIVLYLFGDSEAETIIEALGFIKHILVKQRSINIAKKKETT